ncbi:hypothetical protein DFH06DRAFT_673057 [Mycena polygramma]|nr:hypothetical protein DFH06DRAFT_673057 [Mycena polygramma]
MVKPRTLPIPSAASGRRPCLPQTACRPSPRRMPDHPLAPACFIIIHRMRPRPTRTYWGCCMEATVPPDYTPPDDLVQYASAFCRPPHPRACCSPTPTVVLPCPCASRLHPVRSPDASRGRPRSPLCCSLNLGCLVPPRTTYLPSPSSYTPSYEGARPAALFLRAPRAGRPYRHVRPSQRPCRPLSMSFPRCPSSSKPACLSKCSAVLPETLVVPLRIVAQWLHPARRGDIIRPRGACGYAQLSRFLRSRTHQPRTRNSRAHRRSPPVPLACRT